MSDQTIKRVLVLYGSNYNFRDDSGRLVLGGKVFLVDGNLLDHGGADGDSNDVANGYPIQKFTLSYESFLSSFKGAGVYDAVFEYSITRSFSIIQQLVDLEFICPVSFDFNNLDQFISIPNVS